MVLEPMVSFSSIDAGTLPVRMFPGISSASLICILQARRFRRRMIVRGGQPLPGADGIPTLQNDVTEPN